MIAPCRRASATSTPSRRSIQSCTTVAVGCQAEGDKVPTHGLLTRQLLGADGVALALEIPDVALSVQLWVASAVAQPELDPVHGVTFSELRVVRLREEARHPVERPAPRSWFCWMDFACRRNH